MIYCRWEEGIQMKAKNLRAKKRAGIGRVFARLIACYTALIAIFAGVCGYSYAQAMKMSVSNLVSRNQLIFESSAFTLQNTFDTMESFTANLYGLKQLQQLLGGANWSAEGKTMDIYDTIHALPAIEDANGIISGYFVYIPGGDVIVAPGQGFVRIEQYYADHFAISAGQEYESWRAQVLLGEGKSIHADWQTGQEMQFVMPLGNAVTGGKPGKVVYRISTASLLKQLTHFSDGADQHALVMDLDGNVLAASPGSEELVRSFQESGAAAVDSTGEISVLGDTFRYSAQAVPEFGVRLMLLVPHSAIVRQAGASIAGMVTILLWMLLIGVVAIVALVLSNVLPLRKIASQAAQAKTSAKGMWMISEAFTQMESHKLQLEKRLEEQRVHMRSACVQRLIHAGEQDPYNLEEMLCDCGIAIPGSRFCGVLIECLGAQPLEASRAMLLEILDQHRTHFTFLSFEKSNVISCLFSQQEEERIDVRALFSQFYEMLRSTCGFDMAIYVGTPCDALEKIAQSFATAEWLMRTSQHTEWLRMAEDDGGASADLNSILPQETEKNLENCVMTGDQDSVAQMLSALYQRNFVESHLQGFNRQYLYCRLVGILAACGANLSERADAPEGLMQMDGEAFFTYLNARFSQCCERAQSRNNQRSQRLIDEVCAYIEAHYAQYDLSLNSLSVRFGITGNYLSSLFKKQKGVNFSAYLEEVRIGHAETMLRSHEGTIDEIAQKTGYTNADSFRRAFRRVRGVSPSQWRETAADRSADGSDR